MTRSDGYITDADRSLRDTYTDPMSLTEYLEAAFETPAIASHASKYLLEAINAAGTRTVIEEGEETERYRFFDDPHNDGEHAILGNTDVLNAFVDDLRAIATGRGKVGSIVWFAGPTATGKSELKRCLINGLREYSKTPDGRRFTLEWNLPRSDGTDQVRYSAAAASGKDNWHESPVQVHPLAVFPQSVRTELLSDLNAQVADGTEIRVTETLDPFSQDAYERLEEAYRDKGRQDLFSRITDTDNLRVTNYVVDVGKGIGVLYAEDSGSPKARLVGSWMTEVLGDLDSRGRKNPQAFSYDGVLSQGNGGLTIVEDASQHADLIQQLLSVPEEGTVKLDRGIEMDVDTQLIIISNLDLEDQLNQHEDRAMADPYKALKRRLDKHEFGYLTNISLETELLRRGLLDEREIWNADDYENLDAKIRESVTITIQNNDKGVVDREFAPHAFEAAALFDVVTRIDPDGLPRDLTLTETALLYDRGFLTNGDERLAKADFDFPDNPRDGKQGIPVTYTRDILSDLLASERDRSHPDLPVEHVIMPENVLTAMVDGLVDAPVIAQSERREYEDRVGPVREYIHARQEEDVLNAMLEGHRADAESVSTYVENVYAWATDESVESDRGQPSEPDPLAMKLFEIEQLGRFTEANYESTDPSDEVVSFRREKLIPAVNRRAWEHRSSDFEVGDIDFTAISVLRDALTRAGWDDVRRVFEDFDPRQWEDPPGDTQTGHVRNETIERLQRRGYSPAAAELTSQHVMDRVTHQWD